MAEKIYICTTGERLDLVKGIAGSALVAIEEPLLEGDGYLVIIQATQDEWNILKVLITEF